MMTWKFIKTYAFAVFFTVMLIAVFGFKIISSGTTASFQSKDCLPGYDELYFGDGAYACQRSNDKISN